MSDVKIEVKDLPLISKMIEEIALFTLKEFIRTTDVKEFNKLKKELLQEEL